LPRKGGGLYFSCVDENGELNDLILHEPANAGKNL